MYRFGDVFTYVSSDGDSDYYYKCTLLKDICGYRRGTYFDYIWLDRIILKLWFCMFDDGEYTMTEQLTTVG